MALEIRIVDPSPTQLAQLLAIMYPGQAIGSATLSTMAQSVLEHGDRPDVGAPNEVDAGQAFGGANADLAPSVAFASAGLSPEAAFSGGAGGSNTTTAATGNVAGAASAPIAPAAVGSPAALAPAPGVSAPSAPGGVELDAKGLPWDVRIHAKAATGGGTKNADGTWRAKRGVNDAALVARVESELRAVMGAPGPVAGGVPAVPNAPGAGALSPTIAAPVPPAPPAVGGVPPAPPALMGTTQPTGNYVELVRQIAGAMASGKLTPAEVQAACIEFGIPDLPLLATRLDLVTSVSSRINQILSMKG